MHSLPYGVTLGNVNTNTMKSVPALSNFSPSIIRLLIVCYNIGTLMRSEYIARNHYNPNSNAYDLI